MDLNAMIDMFIKKLSSTTETTATLQWISKIMIFGQAMLQWKWMMSKRQCYLTNNSYAFYEVDNSYKFVRPHSYDFVRFV